MAGDDQGIAELAGRAIAIAEQTAATQKSIADTQKTIIAEQDATATWKRRAVALFWAGFVSLAVDIGLTIAIFLVTNHQGDLSRQLRQTQAAQAVIIHAIHESQLTACAIGNGFRLSQQQVWDHFIATSTAPPGETPAQRAARLARLAAARTYISQHYQPVDCTALYGK